MNALDLFLVDNLLVYEEIVRKSRLCIILLLLLFFLHISFLLCQMLVSIMYIIIIQKQFPEWSCFSSILRALK